MSTRNAIGSNKPIEVSFGGTGLATTSTYAVLCGGTTATNPLQQVASLGSANEVLTSQGAGALPIWSSASGGVPNYTGLTNFTPTLNFTSGSTGVTTNPATTLGRYIIIGDLKYVYISLELTAKGSDTGTVYLSGMPAATGSVPDNQQLLNGFSQLLASSPSNYIQATITTNPIGGTTAISFIYPQNSTGSTTSFLTDANLGNTTSFGVTGVYI